MLDRRIEILEPVSHDINTKAYCNQMQEVWYEMIQIYAELHTRALEISRSGKGKSKASTAQLQHKKMSHPQLNYRTNKRVTCSSTTARTDDGVTNSSTTARTNETPTAELQRKQTSQLQLN